MKAVTTYKSSDGKIFETMRDCASHEASLKKARARSFLAENNVKFYDEYYEEIKPDDSKCFYNEVYYIRFIDVNTEELLRLKEHLDDYYGYSINFGSSDLIYCYEDECFVSLEEKIEGIKDELYRYEQIKHELEG